LAESIECKGRNGYFKLDCIDTWKIGDELRIEFFSKKRGDAAPMVIAGPKEKIKALITKLFTQIVNLQNLGIIEIE